MTRIERKEAEDWKAIDYIEFTENLIVWLSSFLKTMLFQSEKKSHNDKKKWNSHDKKVNQIWIKQKSKIPSQLRWSRCGNNQMCQNAGHCFATFVHFSAVTSPTAEWKKFQQRLLCLNFALCVNHNQGRLGPLEIIKCFGKKEKKNTIMSTLFKMSILGIRWNWWPTSDELKPVNQKKVHMVERGLHSAAFERSFLFPFLLFLENFKFD